MRARLFVFKERICACLYRCVRLLALRKCLCFFLMCMYIFVNMCMSMSTYVCVHVFGGSA